MLVSGFFKADIHQDLALKQHKELLILGLEH